MASHNDFGKKGEDAALDFLKKLGHEILVQNYRYSRAEVDIISRHQGIVIFTEVKTRSSEKFGYPEEFVGKPKMKLMKEAAEEYLYRNNLETEVRFDIISVTPVKGELKVHHIEDAFFYDGKDSDY